MKLESPPATPQGPDAFGPLINATCELVGVAPATAWLDLPMKDYRCATFQVDGVECLVSHRSIDPEALFIHCVFGPVPEVRSADVLLALLQLNLTLYGGGSPTFGADTERNLLLCMEERLQDMRAEDLAQRLENLATQAMGWRKVWLAHG
ncbi:MAG: CesT family type III secretion system chaperone [Hydrogenophaga sp.]|uniref:CesT family type III secretion system chaperone n=1 Tax=unclassified Hydrogenophaga TaxID=2610897 RepID=UPI0036D26A90